MWRRLAVGALLALGGFGAAVGSAQAHAIILESRPTLNGAFEAGTLDIFLRFNSRIDQARSRLSLVLPDGRTQPLTVGENADPALVTARATGLAAGPHTLRWQVLAVDGHLTRGEIPFKVGGK
jgi:methionine-rich copper-binding protein CopC